MFQMLDIQEAAKVLAISERTLYSLTKSGEIPALKLQRAVRYRLSDLEEWAAKKISSCVLDKSISNDILSNDATRKDPTGN